jgi:2-polyprenyl-3-methyl-5-hydroxy-6-metoxy-1,4-benzoquinol methylase
MSPQSIAKLNAINKTFYQKQADSFDSTRQHPWNGWQQLTPHLEHKPLAVLDLGCGNGRFEQFLVANNISLSSYTGMDLSAELLQRAASEQRNAVHERSFQQIDFTHAKQWPKPQKQFDLVVMLALLHHIPSRALRKQLIRYAASLLHPTGLLILSLWHYELDPRFVQKKVSWKHVPEIQPSELEPGDYLLNWQNDPQKLRYVHIVDQEETHDYIKSSGLRLLHEFRADGASNNLNHYLLLG